MRTMPATALPLNQSICALQKPTFLGKGVDIVYDAVGGPTSIETLRCVNFGARFCIVGWTSTPFVAKGKVSREPLS